MTAYEAENGAVALDWLEANPLPSLILLDIMMPVMDGVEFLERLRSRHSWRTLPVIVVTAKDLTRHDREVLEGLSQKIVAKGETVGGDLRRVIRQTLTAIGGR